MSNEVSQHNDITRMLASATRHHQAGRLAEAEVMYQEILQKHPDQPDALQYLGIIAHHKNDTQGAIDLIRRAISINPFSADYYVNLGAIYKHIGRFREALECYQTAIQLQPDSAEAYNNLGNVFNEQGRQDVALETFKKAIELKPDFSKALNNIGMVCQAQKKFDEATEYFQKAITAEPNFTDAHNNLGNILMAQGKTSEAFEFFNQALKFNPNYLQARFNLGNAYASQGDFEAAEECYRTVLNTNPGFFDALFNLARILAGKKQYQNALEMFLRAQQSRPYSPHVYHQIGMVQQELNRINDAIDNFIKAIRLKSDFADAYYNLGNAYYGTRRFQESSEAYKKSIEIRPEFSESYNNLGNVLAEMGYIDQGEEALRKALELKPEYDAALNNLGNIYKQRGKRKEAIDCYNKALSITPDYPEAHRHLTLTTKYNKDNLSHAEQIQAALKKDNLSDSDIMHLNFGLGKIYDDCKLVDEAFKYYKKANDIRHQQMKFDSAKHSLFIDQVLNTFNDQFFKQRALFGHESELPVLIVGMPRSGTTLTEQIISSHPSAAAAGELVAVHQMELILGRQLRMNKPYPENVRFLEEQTTLNFANEYIRYLKTFSEDAERITDKMPDNFLSLGFFKLLFPKGHVIHCRRNPIDTCLSIYFQFFVQANGYAYDLETLGKYYNDYERIMDYWRQSPHIRMYELQYEELVNNQEKISKEIIEYIDLEWDENCIDFHKNKRPVRTASSAQVRKPMYKNSIGRWKAYEKYLAPLIDTLNTKMTD